MAIEIEGSTEFWADRSVDQTKDGYRFVVSVANEKLQIWLENRKTKHQWRTSDLRVADFVTEESAIPQAKTRDYAERFAECLEEKLGDDEDSAVRHLSAIAKDGACTLRLTVRLAWSKYEAQLEYRFQLLPVALEEGDFLAARVRDVHDDVQAQKKRIDALEAPRMFVEFSACANAGANQCISWQPVSGETSPAIFVVDSDKLQVVAAGLYMICCHLTHLSSSNTAQFHVQLNGAVLRSFTDGIVCNYQRQTTFTIVSQIPANASVQIVYKGNSFAYAGSLVSFTKL